MPYDPAKHHRRSVRLKDYDYSQPGAYFVTIVTHQRQNLFGQVVGEQMKLNKLGRVAAYAWQEIPRHFQFVRLGAFVVMPNHVHAIVFIDDQEPDSPKGDHLAPNSLGAIINYFKAITTRRIRATNPGLEVWQRGFHEHILRTDAELNSTYAYITGNPVMWAEDEENQELIPA